jgi:hypothetical protein
MLVFNGTKGTEEKLSALLLVEPLCRRLLSLEKTLMLNVLKYGGLAPGSRSVSSFFAQFDIKMDVSQLATEIKSECT